MVNHRTELGERRHTRTLVVANREKRRHRRANIAQTLRALASTRAVKGGAANLRGLLPDDLGEVTETVKAGLKVTGDLGSRLAVVGLESADFAVVEQISDNGANVLGTGTGSDVLAIPAAISGTVK